MNVDKIKYKYPYSCYINLTSKCNLRCKHCFGSYSIQLDNELSLDNWKKIIDELIKNKVFFVNISGGEPTQSPFFKAFIRYLSQRGLHFILTTNGVFSKETREFIIKNKEYLIGVKISLDGPDAESHGFIRLDSNKQYNPNIFKITLNNIYSLKNEKIPLTIATVLHKENINKIKELRNLIKKINPISWFISPIIPIGRADSNKFISEFYENFEIDFWNELYLKGKNEKINVRLIDMPTMGKERLSAYECAGAINFCEINSDGKVSPCTLSRLCIPENKMKFNNIKEKSLKDIWDGEVFNKFRNFMNKGCNGCKMIKNCNKCVAQSYKYFNNGTSPTPYCIKKGKILGLKNLEKYKEILNKSK